MALTGNNASDSGRSGNVPVDLSSIAIIVVSVCVTVIAILVGGSVFCCCCFRRKSHKKKQNAQNVYNVEDQVMANLEAK